MEILNYWLAGHLAEKSQFIKMQTQCVPMSLLTQYDVSDYTILIATFR
jgi:hypothetical protein